MNGRKLVILIVTGTAAFGLLMTWWARAVGFPKHPPAPAPVSAKATLAHKPPPTDKSTGKAVLANMSTPTTEQTSSLPKTSAEKQALLMQAALAIQKKNAQRYTLALTHWNKEKRDSAWATVREKALRKALESDKIAITPDQLECRATLCRLALHPPSPLPNAPAMRAEIGASSAVGSEGAGPSRMMILFIPREGQSLDG